MSNYTPGPWQVLPAEADKPYLRVRGTVLGERYKIANVQTHIVMQGSAWDEFNQRETEQTASNARLIASAPELLEALKDAVAALGGIHSDNVPDTVRAAIAKAEGEQA